MNYYLIKEGEQARIFNAEKLKTPPNMASWIPQDDAIKYVKTEEIKITRNGTYYPPEGTFYSKVKVNIRKKKKGGSGSDNGEKSPTNKDVTISQARTRMNFSGVQKLTTTTSDGKTISWIPEEDAPYYVKAEALNVSDNDIYIPDEGTLYKSVTVNVEFDDDDPTDPDNPGGGDNPGGKTELKLITKEITANGTYTAADEGVDGYESVIVNVVSGKEPYINDGKYVSENGVYAPSSSDGFNVFGAFIEPYRSAYANIDRNGIYKAATSGEEKIYSIYACEVRVRDYEVKTLLGTEEFVNLVLRVWENMNNITDEEEKNRMKGMITNPSPPEYPIYTAEITSSYVRIYCWEAFKPPFRLHNVDKPRGKSDAYARAPLIEPMKADFPWKSSVWGYDARWGDGSISSPPSDSKSHGYIQIGYVTDGKATTFSNINCSLAA